ncbi:PREDICTED: uncharacterized protein K02A2.6-like [Ipomoea nil]|uniref:uncharacterized protein K02A2.6-like n=1 Tax=Ipomoea nil TaxID=35883 RepID=UPI000900D225|nr:PREDICTED: uncharacterized protein K02A2.6-like [Ipomoea nil]
MEWIAKCSICQVFARKDTRPATFYTPVTTAIPLAKWGIDLLGPLPAAPGNLKFCVVAIDYFTKWVEAEPLATITEYLCRRFLWKRVICRFGLPEHVVSDNGRQFDCQAFADFCRRHSIRHTKVSVAYPQANGQVENVNQTIVDGIWKKLEDIGGNWADELDRVLWAYRTTQRRATGESPFSLAYGFEAKVPVEVVEPTYWVRSYSDEENEESLRIEKNFLEERREVACARMVEYQKTVKRYRDRRIRPRAFQRSPFGATSSVQQSPTTIRTENVPTPLNSPPLGTARVTAQDGSFVEVAVPEQLTFRRTFSIPLDDLDGPATGLMKDADFARYLEMYPDDEEPVADVDEAGEKTVELGTN